jgi:hypothetical protein
MDVNRSARHLAANVTAGAATNVALSPRDMRTDAVDAGEVALELEPGITRITADVEELGQRKLPVPVKHLDALNLVE